MKPNPIDNNQEFFVIFLAIQQASDKKNGEVEEEKENEEDTKFLKQASEKHQSNRHCVISSLF